jgi:hypothetical protein
MKIVSQWMLHMFSVFIRSISKVVLDRSIKAGMVIQKAVFKMKIGEPVDVQFNVFTRSIFKVSPD